MQILAENGFDDIESFKFLNIEVLEKLKTLGLKTVEWTGGGDPTMYHHLEKAIYVANLITLCEDCHNEIHKKNVQHIKVKTTKGFVLQEI
jgi:hypothetical protein